MRDPAITDDGQSYERKEIEAWFKTLSEANEPITSPLLAPLKSAQLLSNHSLRCAIEAAVHAELGARDDRESVLFIGTQFSILYTFMYSPS
jgi:hypothetical protein